MRNESTLYVLCVSLFTLTIAAHPAQSADDSETVIDLKQLPRDQRDPMTIAWNAPSQSIRQSVMDVVHDMRGADLQRWSETLSRLTHAYTEAWRHYRSVAGNCHPLQMIQRHAGAGLWGQLEPGHIVRLATSASVIEVGSLVADHQDHIDQPTWQHGFNLVLGYTQTGRSRLAFWEGQHPQQLSWVTIRIDQKPHRQEKVLTVFATSDLSNAPAASTGYLLEKYRQTPSGDYHRFYQRHLSRAQARRYRNAWINVTQRPLDLP